jgi:hypothetical protein
MATQRSAFEAVFQDGSFVRTALTQAAMYRPFAIPDIHSAFWKFFLFIAPDLPAPIAGFPAWSATLAAKRDEYSRIRAQFPVAQPRDSADPLRSPEWLEFHEFQRITSTFVHDVNRIFQDDPYFDRANRDNQPKLDALRDLRYLHLRANPEIAYQQGFHELAAVVYFVFRCEMRAAYDPGDPFAALFAREFLDADAFWAYSALVSHVVRAQFYGSCDVAAPVHGRLLAMDPEIPRALAAREVQCRVFVVAWMRTLFVRSVGLREVPALWSAIFARLPSFADFVSLLAVGHFLLYTRAITAAADSSEIYRAFSAPATAACGRTEREIAASLVMFANWSPLRNWAAEPDGGDVAGEFLEELVNAWERGGNARISRTLTVGWFQGDAPDSPPAPLPRASDSGTASTAALGIDEETDDAPVAQLTELLRGSAIFRD